MPMSDKTLRAINRGRRKAGLKPIRRKGTTKGEVRKTARRAYEPKKNEISVKTETMWGLAKQKFKADRQGLYEYYYSVPYRLRKKYGLPKKAPHVDTRKERERSRDRMNQGECIQCKRQSVSLRDGYCAMCD